MKTYFDNKRGIKVTDQFLTTRYKNEAIAPIKSVVVGREPLWMALVIGLGLTLCAVNFSDLLFWYESAFLLGLAMSTTIAGFSISNLKVGQYMHEKTMFWHSIWTVLEVRKAILNALAEQQNRDATNIVPMDAD